MRGEAEGKVDVCVCVCVCVCVSHRMKQIFHMKDEEEAMAGVTDAEAAKV